MKPPLRVVLLGREGEAEAMAELAAATRQPAKPVPGAVVLREPGRHPTERVATGDRATGAVGDGDGCSSCRPSATSKRSAIRQRGSHVHRR